MPIVITGGLICAKSSACRTAVKAAIAATAAYIGSRMLSQPPDVPVQYNQPEGGEESGADSGGGGKPRFIAQPDGQIVDTDAAPPGSYDQPDGGRTDILQGEDHGSGRTHTHDPIVHANPKTGESFVNGRERSGRAVSEEGVRNIEGGAAPRSKPTGRGR